MKREHEFTLWVVIIALGLHFLEEYGLDLRSWLEYGLAVPVTWEQCHLVNVAVTLFAIGGAVVGWRVPEISLIMPAVVIFNALGFHLGFSILWQRYSPGTASALLLFVPAGLWAFVGASRDGVLSRRAIVCAIVGALGFHLYLLGFHLMGPPPG
jgi:hypothetical protein